MSATAAQISGPIVVTGGAGFLGGVVVEQLLARGITDIRVVDLVDGKGRKDARGTVRHFTCDLRTDPLNGAFAGAKTVLHLAACQYHTPLARSTYELPFYEINVNATRHVLDAAEKAGDGRGRNELVRFVFVSTSMVYGLPQSLPITEDHPRNPFGPYGQSKLEAERRVEAAHSKKLDCAIVRPGLIVGPGRVGVIGRLFGWIRKNRPIVMIGNADNRYELMHVADVASLVLAAASTAGSASTTARRRRCRRCVSGSRR
jgi:nucleoside-diphosphate-sugar epimerase